MRGDIDLGTLYQTCQPELAIDFVQRGYWFRRARTLGLNPSTTEHSE